MATKHAIIETDGDDLIYADYSVLWNVVDGHRTYFDPQTYWGPATRQPVMFGHGFDATLRAAPLGYVKEREDRDLGQWVVSQIEKARQYYDQAQKLIKARAVGYSVGTFPGGLVEEKTEHRGVKRIAQWLLSEMTLTTNPSQVHLASNPDAMVRSIMDYDGSAQMWRMGHQISARECRLMELHLSEMLHARKVTHGGDKRRTV